MKKNLLEKQKEMKERQLRSRSKRINLPESKTSEVSYKEYKKILAAHRKVLRAEQKAKDKIAFDNRQPQPRRNLNFKHGLSKTPEYHVWASLLGKCFSRTSASFPDYGGRGITVCRRWKKSFLNFFSDMGIRPEGMWIERVDNDGDYEPSNCVWATPKEQANNRTRVRLFNGKEVRSPAPVKEIKVSKSKKCTSFAEVEDINWFGE